MNLRALNSATKYPSILTHHALDPRNGGLLEDQPTMFPDGQPVLATEKIDGTNARIIVVGDDWFIGSREDLLTARGDRVINPALGIVAALAETAERITNSGTSDDDVVSVFYLELYGGKQLPAWKMYGDGSRAGWRLFDVALVPVSQLAEDIARIASWRQHGGQEFLRHDQLVQAADRLGLPLVPQIDRLTAADLPTDLAGMRNLLGKLAPRTQAAIGQGADKEPEGIVFRTADRSVITKARFEDYDRTLRRRGGGR